MQGATDQKRRDHQTWAAGDFASIAQLIAETGERIVERVGVRAGDRVLDVACGTGNAAIPAAVAGGDVTALDLTPELFGPGRARARTAGVDLRWVEGDAEDLPFPDDSFDVVLSTFGCMFAPRHEAAAAEIARVLSPGGRLGLCNWTSEGTVGQLFRTVAAHLPSPPGSASSPLLWGDEDHVRRLFSGTAVDLRFETDEAVFSFESVEHGVETYATKFGPIVKAREALEPVGRWPALRDDIGRLFARRNLRSDGTLTYTAEYLVVLGSGPGMRPGDA